MKIIKLEQPSCNPCKMVGNFLDNNNVSYESFDIMDQPEIARKFGAMSTPITILLDDNNNEMQRVVGFNPGELHSLIEQL